MRGTFFGVLKKKDPTIWGTILGSPVFGNSHLGSGVKVWASVSGGLSTMRSSARH